MNRLQLARSTLLVAMAAVSTSCGLFPPMQWVEGTLERDRYTAPDGDFSVAVPFRGEYERDWMQVKERASELEQYVSFGPAAFDHSIFRLSVPRPHPNLVQLGMREIAARGSRGVVEQLEQGFGAPLELLADEAAEVDGKQAWHRRYRQPVPAGVLSDDEGLLYHRLLVVRDGERVWMTWRQWPENNDSGYQEEAMSLEMFAASVQLGDG